MVITFPASQSGNGPRQINPTRDIPQIIELLRLVFGKELDAESLRAFSNIPDSGTPSIFWRFDPFMARLSPGFVWEENGRIVGNVTLLPTRSRSRYLAVNVAVHPDFRRRGIARRLMSLLEDNVDQQGGDEIILQVDHDNEKALRLYRSMGYDVLGTMVSWRSSVSRVRELPSSDGMKPHGFEVRKFDKRRWREAYRLDIAALKPDLQWPEPIQSEVYKKGFWQRTADFLNGRFEQTWMTVDSDNNMSGMATLYSEWGRPYQISLRVHPMWKGQVERELLQKLVTKLRTQTRRNVQLVHIADDETVNHLLIAANFSRSRTLTHMRLDLTN